MSASTGELQPHVDAILELVGVRLQSGQLIVHLADGGRVQGIEVHIIQRPGNGLKKAPSVDNGASIGAK